MSFFWFVNCFCRMFVAKKRSWPQRPKCLGRHNFWQTPKSWRRRGSGSGSATSLLPPHNATVFTASEREEVIKTQLKGHFNLIPLSLSRWLSRRHHKHAMPQVPAKSQGHLAEPPGWATNHQKPDAGPEPNIPGQVKSDRKQKIATPLHLGVRRKRHCSIDAFSVFLSLKDTGKKTTVDIFWFHLYIFFLYSLESCK